MTTMHSDTDNNDVDLDEDDTTGADRGDSLEPETEGEAKKEPARGEDGKFVAKDEEAEEEAEEDEAEVDEEEDDEGEGKSKLDNAGVRLDKMRAQRDAARVAQQQLEARLAALEANATASKETPATVADPIIAMKAEVDALYEQVEEARLDGDAKLAAQLQRQLDEKKEEILEAKAERIASRTTVEASENVRYDALLDKLEADIPLLNQAHEDFDPQAVKALEFYVEAHEKMGMSASRALAAAARIVFDYGKTPAKAEPEKKPDNKVVELKRKSDVKKALEAQGKQPPDTANRGIDKDDTTIDPDDVSDEEWDKMPTSKRKQMRGDFG